jgi:hypothetical protein
MKKIFFFILFFFFFLSLRVEAATLSVAWPQEPLAPESTLSVSIFLETDKPINALVAMLQKELQPQPEVREKRKRKV